MATSIADDRGETLAIEGTIQSDVVPLVLPTGAVMKPLAIVVVSITVVGATANYLNTVVLAGADGRLNHLAGRFDLDGDPSIGSWYSSLALAACSALLLVSGLLHRQRRDRGASAWFVLSAIFLFLSLDESIMLHEMSVNTLRSWAGGNAFLSYPWVVPAMILVGLVGVYFIPFLKRLDRTDRRRFIVAGLVFLSGAVGVETIDSWTYVTYGEASMLHVAAIATEETLEMVGILIFIFALFDHLRRYFPVIRLQVAR